MAWMSPVLLGSSTGQVETLAYIGRIVVDALVPLSDSILSSPTIMPAIHRLNANSYYDHHWTSVYYRRIVEGTSAE